MTLDANLAAGADQWCGFAWTPWVTFEPRSGSFRALPGGAGFYRVRRVGTNILYYIGQTGRSLRGRLCDLRRCTLADEMPFNDPHTAACRLWSFRQEENAAFEVSAAAWAGGDAERKALECRLIWQYRLQVGCSPVCNFGRIHPQYTSSRNRATQCRGVRLPDGQTNPLSCLSMPPLQARGKPFACDWMGLGWSQALALVDGGLRAVPDLPGVYCIGREASCEVLYVGETRSLLGRLTTHFRNRAASGVVFAYCAMPNLRQQVQRLEIENDLIAVVYEATGHPPAWQFGVEL